MMPPSNGIHFGDKKRPLRGLIDIATGRYPGFLFGGSIGTCLPAFHFHEAQQNALEPYFQHLAENRYQTVTCDEIRTYIRTGRSPSPRSVALCFDDAWASLWVVVEPLLRKYDLRAIAFVSPGRIKEADHARAQHDAAANMPSDKLDRTDPMFCTWPELIQLHAQGHVDIQGHSWRHACIFCQETVSDFVTPELRLSPHHVPLADMPTGLRFMSRSDLGAPLYPIRSRFSDARRWIDPDAANRCMQRVDASGGSAFFNNGRWRDELLKTIYISSSGRWETEDEADEAVLEELLRGRQILEERLKKQVRHLCFPWAVAGSRALRLAELAGYETAFSDSIGGYRSIQPGGPPYQLMRLKHTFIFCLPGRNRSWFFGKRQPPASAGLDLAPVCLPAG